MSTSADNHALADRNKKARVEFRVPQEVKELLEQAAELGGVSATDIAIRAIREAARRELESHATTSLDMDEARRFAEALEQPGRSRVELEKAFTRRDNLISDNK